MSFLRRHWKIVVGLWLASLLYWGVPRCFDSWQLAHRQEELLRAIEQRNPKAYADLIAPSYADDWKFTNDLIRKMMDDISAQFLTLKITPQSPQWQSEGTEAKFTTGFTLSGKPITPAGELILTEGSRPHDPFTFVWKREGWGAWTWKLVAVKNPSLEIPDSYEPGSLSETH